MDDKKLAAAISAVFTYIKTSEEAAACAQPEQAQRLAQVDLQPGNLWGISGRQAQMQANAMIQMRAFK